MTRTARRQLRLGLLMILAGWIPSQALADARGQSNAPSPMTAVTTRSSHGTPETIGCGLCHGGTTWTALSPATATATTMPPGFDHDRDTAFALVGGHQQAPCAACHFGPPLIGRGPECRDCHAPVHRTITDTRCERCHGSTDWRPTPQPDAHAEALFPLFGAHRTVACERCHVRGLAREPAALPSRCASCHRSEALKPSIHPDHVRAGFARDCEDCHVETGWQPARVQHDRFWPLEGKHRTADCAGCHIGSQYRTTPKTCAACHINDYNLATNPNHKVQRFSTKCEQCHTSAAGWDRIDPQFHEPYFPISSGHHAGIACATCHAKTTEQFTCTNCHAHERADMDSEHSGVGSYRYESNGCYQCHPTGGDGD